MPVRSWVPRKPFPSHNPPSKDTSVEGVELGGEWGPESDWRLGWWGDFLEIESRYCWKIYSLGRLKRTRNNTHSRNSVDYNNSWVKEFWNRKRPKSLLWENKEEGLSKRGLNRWPRNKRRGYVSPASGSREERRVRGCGWRVYDFRGSRPYDSRLQNDSSRNTNGVSTGFCVIDWDMKRKKRRIGWGKEKTSVIKTLCHSGRWRSGFGIWTSVGSTKGSGVVGLFSRGSGHLRRTNCRVDVQRRRSESKVNGTTTEDCRHWGSKRH